MLDKLGIDLGTFVKQHPLVILWVWRWRPSAAVHGTGPTQGPFRRVGHVLTDVKVIVDDHLLLPVPDDLPTRGLCGEGVVYPVGGSTLPGPRVRGLEVREGRVVKHCLKINYNGKLLLLKDRVTSL